MAMPPWLQLLVCHHDLALGSHLQGLGTPLLEQLWAHMSTALSNLLPNASDWLLLWDHCLAAGPSFYYSLLAAYVLALRQHLLAAGDQQQLERLLDSRPVVHMRKVGAPGRDLFGGTCRGHATAHGMCCPVLAQVIKHAYQLHAATPAFARLGRRALVPLPAASSTYPVFSEYPAGSVDSHARERQRIHEAEEGLVRRRQVGAASSTLCCVVYIMHVPSACSQCVCVSVCVYSSGCVCSSSACLAVTPLCCTAGGGAGAAQQAGVVRDRCAHVAAAAAGGPGCAAAGCHAQD
jgi:hypothetical protein